MSDSFLDSSWRQHLSLIYHPTISIPTRFHLEEKMEMYREITDKNLRCSLEIWSVFLRTAADALSNGFSSVAWFGSKGVESPQFFLILAGWESSALKDAVQRGLESPFCATPATGHCGGATEAGETQAGGKRERAESFPVFFSEEGEKMKVFKKKLVYIAYINGAVLQLGVRCQNGDVLTLTRDPTRPPSWSACFCGKGDIYAPSPYDFAP